MIKYLVIWTIVHTIFISSGINKDPYGRNIEESTIILNKVVTQEQSVNIFSKQKDAIDFVKEYERTANFINTPDICKDFVIDTIRVDSLLTNEQIIKLYSERRKGNDRKK